MYRIVMSVFLLVGEAAAHSGHGAPVVHSHGWEYGLLAVFVFAAIVGWAAEKRVVERRRGKRAIRG